VGLFICSVFETGACHIAQVGLEVSMHYYLALKDLLYHADQVAQAFYLLLFFGNLAC
jgi:hypothetical protein